MDVTHTHEEHQVPPGYENQEIPNPEVHNAGTHHFAGLGDDYHHAMQEMRHWIEKLECHRLELECRLAERSQSRQSPSRSCTIRGHNDHSCEREIPEQQQDNNRRHSRSSQQHRRSPQRNVKPHTTTGSRGRSSGSRGHGKGRVSTESLGTVQSSLSTLTTLLTPVKSQIACDHLVTWIRPSIKKELEANFRNDEGFKHRHLTNVANRALPRSSKYTGGSMTFMKRKGRLSKSLDYEATIANTFKYTHSLKANKERFVEEWFAAHYMSLN
ncbi:hypothetical protein Ahy_A02g009474 [Arachis hypogaea]|uniref:Uncharacterized protein n=1 Tax=Arachis hypogaea TaxID=3818 RepID=A0A445EH64_ARAHY|nr:hypothetical protein Ahy_A02g009474 [Arachis hypogaea]